MFPLKNYKWNKNILLELGDINLGQTERLWKMQLELKAGETVQNVHLKERNHQMDKRKCGNKWCGRRLWGLRWSHLTSASWECSPGKGNFV